MALRGPSLVAITGARHGLGNRVRVVLGARSLAQLEARRFFYTWSVGRDFGCRFDELWEPRNSSDGRPELATLPRTIAGILSTRFPFRDETLAWLDDKSRAERIIQIRTPHALKLPQNAESWESGLRALAPTAQVADRIRSLHRTLADQAYVGVMVRAHPRSHAATLRESPLDWYLGRMRRIRESSPQIPFYLSADTTAASDWLSDRVPGCHVLTEKGAYNSAQALRSAVVDLYLLAASGHVLAPHYSSFPELSRSLAGPSLVLETSQNNAAFDAERGAAGLDRVEDATAPHLRVSAG